MVMEREEGQTADAVASRLATLIEPGSLLEATPECLVVAHADGREEIEAFLISNA